MQRPKRIVPPPGRKLTAAEAREFVRKQFAKCFEMLAKHYEGRA